MELGWFEKIMLTLGFLFVGGLIFALALTEPLLALALGTVMILSATAFGWAYQNSEKEREELSKATTQLGAEIWKVYEPIFARLSRLLSRR